MFSSKAIVTCFKNYRFGLKPNSSNSSQPLRSVKVRQERLVITCGSDGQWKVLSLTILNDSDTGGGGASGRKLMTGTALSRLHCQSRACPAPPYVKNGMVEFSGLRVGSMARLEPTNNIIT